ncbi:MAG: nicotinate phosphoribosyltransferase [Eubacteriales bacterium]|nr:nicotinate phosphoribosyltransferase [Eubacteriales bacterium]
MRLSLNPAMMMDFYELTMSQVFFDEGIHEQTACFDLFFRRIPESGGYALMAGLQPVIDYLNNFKFRDEDISYLRSLGRFSEAFLAYLADMKFSCDVWAIREGTPLFPHEPIMKVRGPLIQAQLIETMLLLTINHQCLIATKAARIVRAAEGRQVMEFGARRAQGADAAFYGARSAYIGGVDASSLTASGEHFDMPVAGTMAHSFVQSFPDEYSAFRAYAKRYPESCVLLIDTYNTLDQGLPNAIRIQREILDPLGYRLKGVRIDSGDLAYLSVRAREILDEAGMHECKIIASNSLDEDIIRELLRQGARIDSFGVGERLITAKSEPVFGGVYKLSAIEVNGVLEARMKISENVAKVTNPGSKRVYRFYDRDTDMALADLICLEGESVDPDSYEIFDPVQTWKRKVLENYYVRDLLEPVFEAGKCVYPDYDLASIRLYAQKQQAQLWDAVKRFEFPHQYYVDLSEKLWTLKQNFLAQHANKHRLKK